MSKTNDPNQLYDISLTELYFQTSQEFVNCWSFRESGFLRVLHTYSTSTSMYDKELFCIFLVPPPFFHGFDFMVKYMSITSMVYCAYMDYNSVRISYRNCM